MVSPPLLELLTTMDFGQRLATLRRERGLTQPALADRIGIHVSQLCRYGAGTSQPTLDVLRRLATSADVLLVNPMYAPSPTTSPTTSKPSANSTPTNAQPSAPSSKAPSSDTKPANSLPADTLAEMRRQVLAGRQDLDTHQPVQAIEVEDYRPVHNRSSHGSVRNRIAQIDVRRVSLPVPVNAAPTRRLRSLPEPFRPLPRRGASTI